MASFQDITTIILAGGQARRLHGRNKALISINQQSILSRILNLVEAKTGNIVISTNLTADAFQEYPFPLVRDQFKDYQGPLAGILSASSIVNTELVLVLPCDMPFLPDNLVDKLLEGYQLYPDKIQVAFGGSQLQPLVLLFHRRHLAGLQKFFDQGQRAARVWLEEAGCHLVKFDDNELDFFNINTPADLSRATGSV